MTEREELKATLAYVTRLPFRSGDGYSWGGEVILNIGERSLIIGATKADEELAKCMAESWNRRSDG